MRLFRNYLRETYNVPAKYGRKVEQYYYLGGQWNFHFTGRITSRFWHTELYISNVGPFNPLIGLVYYDDQDNVLLDTRNAFSNHPGNRTDR